MLKPRRLTAALKPDGGILPAKTRPGEGTESGFGQKFVGAANVADGLKADRRPVGVMSALPPKAYFFIAIAECPHAQCPVSDGVALDQCDSAFSITIISIKR